MSIELQNAEKKLKQYKEQVNNITKKTQKLTGKNASNAQEILLKRLKRNIKALEDDIEILKQNDYVNKNHYSLN